MGSASLNLEFHVEAGDTATFFRWLGEGLAVGNLQQDGSHVDLAGYAKLRLAVEPGPAGSLDVSLKVKYPKKHPAPVRVPAAEGAVRPAKPKRTVSKAGGAAGYKALKKRMGTVFRSVRAALDSGALPRADDVHAFLDDSRRMCTFKGKGDPMYPAFLTTLDLFGNALAAGDMSEARRLAAEMQRMKKECHGRFK